MRAIRVDLSVCCGLEAVEWAASIVAHLQAAYKLAPDEAWQATLNDMVGKAASLVALVGGRPQTLRTARQAGVRWEGPDALDAGAFWGCWHRAGAAALALACSRGVSANPDSEACCIFAADLARRVLHSDTESARLPAQVARQASLAVEGHMGDPGDALDRWFA